jgi:hypothetical protein
MSTTTTPIRFQAWAVAQVAAVTKARAARPAWAVLAQVALRVIRARVVPAPVAARVSRVKGVPLKVRAVREKVVQARGALPVARVFKDRVDLVRGAKVVRARVVRVKVAGRVVLKVRASSVSRARPMVALLRPVAKAQDAAASLIRCRRRSVLPIPVRAAIQPVQAKVVRVRGRDVPSKVVRRKRGRAWIRACRVAAARVDGDSARFNRGLRR